MTSFYFNKKFFFNHKLRAMNDCKFQRFKNISRVLNDPLFLRLKLVLKSRPLDEFIWYIIDFLCFLVYIGIGP